VFDETKKKLKLNFLLEKGVPYLAKIFLLSLIGNLLTGIAVFLIYIAPPEPDNYSTSVNGQTGELVPLLNPNTSDSVVTQWANLATIGAFTYDFVNYQSQLEAASAYFTTDGWNSFMQSLQDSNNLKTVISKKLVVSAVALSPPLILKKGFVNGVYAWRIQLPILVTYQSASDVTQMKMVVNLLMTRIPTRDNYKGIGIEQFSSVGYFGDQMGLNI
jgi:intracellular multiplication protein IcmL